MQLTNPVKERLQAGETVLGVFIPMPSPEVVEVCAVAGFDFVMLDAEHGRISPTTAYPMILAAEARGVPALARVGQNDRQVILKFLDIGITGVMIPQTNTPEQAQAAVDAMRYHPRGIRGVAGGRTFGFGFGAVASELIPQLSERVLSMIQFEHIAALDHLDALLALPEVDVLFVGPNDLSQSMGYPGQPGHPEVEAVVEQICERARGHRVALGTVAPDAAAANRRREQGFRMIVGNAAALLGQGAQQMIAGFER